MELKIPEVILIKRREKNLTQEELAAALGVSAQAVSNWERGGYPDITLLPKIAAFFEITVDELIGSDAATREEDIRSFTDRYRSGIENGKEGWIRKLALAKEFCLKAAGASIGCGRTDEGFALLEKAFPLYERWLKIPEGTRMAAGCPALFGEAKINK
ncbi:MAG: helix-turn-helix transcriptional regulator [Clostridia bacterium]|nr:helix-turn-helix transcriptional regulator [Clostridia bacterium]